MKKISAEMIMNWCPCKAYPLEKVSELVPHAMTPLEILSLRIPAADRLWVVLRRGVLPDRILRLFAASCAERALRRERRAGREPDPRSWDACRVARLHADGQASDEELATASAAARAATRAAALAAVSFAASAAARAATRATTRAAARAATSTATSAATSIAICAADWAATSIAICAADWTAAWAASGAAERRWQVDTLRNLIKEIGEKGTSR